MVHYFPISKGQKMLKSDDLEVHLRCLSYFVVLLRILGFALIVRLTTANLTVLFTLLNGSHVKYIFGFTTQQSEYLKSLAKCLTPLSF